MTLGTPDRVATLVAAGAAAWEAPVLDRLAASSGHVVLVKRCLDLTDLLATAATGTAWVALVSHALPGLDADSVDRLGRAGVRVVAVVDDRDAEEQRMLRLGVTAVVLSGRPDEVVPAGRARGLPGGAGAGAPPVGLPRRAASGTPRAARARPRPAGPTGPRR